MYRRRIPKPIEYYTLLFTSDRILVTKALPTWIKLSPLYAKGLSYFIMRESWKKHNETFKKLPVDEILKFDKENFEVLYSDTREVRLHKKHFGHKLSIKFDGTELQYNILDKKAEVIENVEPFYVQL